MLRTVILTLATLRSPSAAARRACGMRCRRRKASAPSPSAIGPPIPTWARRTPIPIPRRGRRAKACWRWAAPRGWLLSDRDSSGDTLSRKCSYVIEGATPPARFWTFYAADRSLAYRARQGQAQARCQLGVAAAQCRQLLHDDEWPGPYPRQLAQRFGRTGDGVRADLL